MPNFICSLNLEQSRVDSCTALSTLRPQIAMVWSNCLFVVEIESRAGYILLDMSSLPLAAFQRLNAQSSNVYRSVIASAVLAVLSSPGQSRPMLMAVGISPSPRKCVMPL